MKTYIPILILSLFLTIFIGKNGFAQQGCPTNFDGYAADFVKDNSKAWMGKTVACDIMIDSVIIAHKDKPYYLVRLTHNYNRIWVGSLIDTKYKKGDMLKILGYLVEIPKDDIMTQYNTEGYHILAFVFVDPNTKKAAILPDAKKQAYEWFNGAIPKDLD